VGVSTGLRHVAVGHLGVDTHVIEWSGEHGQRDRARAGTALFRVGEIPALEGAIAPTISQTSTSSPTTRIMYLSLDSRPAAGPTGEP
jgi:hypothetical protein